MDPLFARSKHALFWICTGILLLFLSVSYILFVKLPGGDGNDALTEGIPSGTLFLSLKPKDTNLLETYTLSVGSREATLERFRPEEGHTVTFASAEDGIVAAVHLDPALLIGLTEDIKEKVQKKGSQIYLYQNGQQGVEMKKVTDNARPFKRLPKLSPDGEKLVYNAFRDDDLRIMRNVEDWSVVTVDVKTGEESVIANGMFPQWLDNDSIVYMDNAGIGVYSLKDQKVTRLLESGSPTVSVPNMMFDVSDNGNLLAWTQPDKGTLYLYELDRDQNFKPTQRAEANTHGFWPQISRDGKYVAVQSVDWENIDTDPKPKLLLYSAQDMSRVGGELSLDQYIQDSMFLTDWQ